MKPADALRQELRDAWNPEAQKELIFNTFQGCTGGLFGVDYCEYYFVHWEKVVYPSHSEASAYAKARCWDRRSGW